MESYSRYFVPFMYYMITWLNTHCEKLLDSDLLRDCEFIHNLRVNSVTRTKVQVSLKGKDL